MNLPNCVAVCEHPQLKNDAIAAWTIGTQEEQDAAITACMLYNMRNDDVQQKNQRREDFQMWLKYFKATVLQPSNAT